MPYTVARKSSTLRYSIEYCTIQVPYRYCIYIIYYIYREKKLKNGRGRERGESERETNGEEERVASDARDASDVPSDASVDAAADNATLVVVIIIFVGVA